MPEFWVNLARKIIKIPEFFGILSRKIIQIAYLSLFRDLYFAWVYKVYV